MKIRSFIKYVYYFKTIGTCIVVVGGYWLVYQLRETSQILKSAVATNVLKLEQTQAQYIYLDDPSFKENFNYHNTNDFDLPASQKRPKIFSNITKWWKSLNYSLACRFLEIAKKGNKDQRARAVHSLGSLKHLKDWHYRYLAQMLDAKTAVALARMSNCDLRFFLKPPYYHVDKKLYEIIDDLYQLLASMDTLCKSNHQCLSEFINKKFLNSQRTTLEFDHDLSSVDFTATPGIPWDQQLLINCIQAIYHHSSIDHFSKDLGNAYGLPVLMEVQKKFSDNVNVCILLARILSILSLDTEHLDDIFRSGWIGVLAAWSRHKDIRLAGPAARALINLDSDGNNGEKFFRRVYLLHPVERTRAQPKLDVIFIHGLLGGVFYTWRQRNNSLPPKPVDSAANSNSNSLTSIIGEHPQEIFKDLAKDLEKREWQQIGQDYEVIFYDCPTSMNSTASGPFTCPGSEISAEDAINNNNNNNKNTRCWPKDWLPQDVPSVRVIGINYESNLSYWRAPCPIESSKSTIHQRSAEFITKLMAAGIGKRPIVWVCHSMGGLLVKNMLVEEWKAGDKYKFCENTKGIIFYSTPHCGSHVAALKQTTQMLLWPSVEVQELREGSPHLLNLHENFLQMLKKNPIKIVSFSETISTRVLKFPIQFVTPQSADPGVGEFYEIPQDHFSICKPANKQSFLYRKVVNFLKTVLKTNDKLND